MNDTDARRLARIGGLCCIAGILCYVTAIFIPLSDRIAYATVMLWPVLSIVFAWAVRGFIASERASLANDLGLVFACLGFATLASMLSAQLAVQMGTAEYATAPGADPALIGTIRKVARMVDLGIDVAWDYLIGTSLFFLGIALARDSRFGRGWGASGTALGIALVVLNTITFPWPPNTRGLFDLGPFIGLYMIALGARLTILGFRRPAAQGPLIA
jgi:hypothetical protein